MITSRLLLAAVVAGSTFCSVGCVSRNSESRQRPASGEYVLVETGLESRIPRRVWRGRASTTQPSAQPTATVRGESIRDLIGEPVVSGSVNVFTR